MSETDLQVQTRHVWLKFFLLPRWKENVWLGQNCSSTCLMVDVFVLLDVWRCVQSHSRSRSCEKKLLNRLACFQSRWSKQMFSWWSSWFPGPCLSVCGCHLANNKADHVRMDDVSCLRWRRCIITIWWTWFQRLFWLGRLQSLFRSWSQLLSHEILEGHPLIANLSSMTRSLTAQVLLSCCQNTLISGASCLLAWLIVAVCSFFLF